MTRQRNTEQWMHEYVLPGTTRWSDYDNGEIYGDYVVEEGSGQVIDVASYLPGIAQTETQSGTIQYFHSDQIGSLRVVSTEYGEPTQMLVYTAFGEKVHEDGTLGTRYQYAGAWGYQSTESPDPLAALGWLHVGHRYYDPSTGRFVQRDPIGIWGGLNVYAYIGNQPTVEVDPDGLLTPGQGGWRQQTRRPNGRFGPKKWWAKKVGPNVWIWAYGLGCVGARGIYWALGETYPDDPHVIIGDILYNYGRAAYSEVTTPGPPYDYTHWGKRRVIGTTGESTFPFF